MDKEDLSDQVFDPKDFKKPIEISYFDLPELLTMSKLGHEFWEAMSETDDLNLFDKQVVKIMINYKWKTVLPQIIKFQMIPYMIFLLFFSIYSNFVYNVDYDRQCEIYADVRCHPVVKGLF